MEIRETKTLQDPIEINYVPLDYLLLDNENPRFAGLVGGASNRELLSRLQKEMHLDELMDSFRANGFYNTEPLLVIKSPKEKNKFVVIEGNRRLAAIKTLLESDKKIDSGLKKQLTERIPIAIYPSRKTLWTYLGFRHINGPQEWDSYSKAVYALRVHKEYNIPIAQIAERIGDRHLTVVKMCNGLMVLEQAQKLGYFRVKDAELSVLYFSHLYTILGYDNTRKFLGITNKKKEVLSDNPIPKKNHGNLRILVEFLFGTKDEKRQSVIRSQNPDVRHLDAVLGSKTATQYLTEYSQEYDALETALTYTAGEDYKFDDLIFKTLESLRKAVGYVNRYKGADDVYRQAGEIKEIAERLVSDMKIRRNK